MIGYSSFIPLERAECGDSLPLSGASSIPLCNVLFPATLLHQLFFHPLLTSSRLLFVGIPLNLVPKFIYNTLLGSFFHSTLLCTFSCHPPPPTILPSSLTSSCHLFLGLPLNVFVIKFMHNTLLGILISSILSTCPNQCNLFNLTVSIIVGSQYSTTQNILLAPPGPQLM